MNFPAPHPFHPASRACVSHHMWCSFFIPGKTEYIRNLLHDSASITVPLRSNGAVPRNHFNHNKGRSVLHASPHPPSRPRPAGIPTALCCRPGPAAAAPAQPPHGAGDPLRVLRAGRAARGPHPARDGLPARPGAVQPAQGGALPLARLLRGARLARGRAALRVLLGHDPRLAAAPAPGHLHLSPRDFCFAFALYGEKFVCSGRWEVSARVS